MKTGNRNPTVVAREAATQKGPRALLVSELYPPDVGGSAVLFREIYSRVPVPITVLTTQRDHPPHPGPEELVRRPISTRRWGFVDPRALAHHFRVAREIRHLTPTREGVVHCGRALPEGVAAYLNRRMFGAPYACWTHGEDLASASSSRELSLLIRRVYAAAAIAFANSRNTAAMLKSMGLSDDRIVTVYPGVDATRFSPDTPGHLEIRRRFISQSGTLLLSVGRLQRRKGHDFAIQAMARLARKYDDLHYVIVGDGEERLRLEQLAQTCGVAGRVHFVGEVSATELPNYFSASDIFLLPNRIDNGDIEGFGIVFLEAASSGKPTVGGNSGGVPEAVTDGTTGLLVSGTDVDELVAVIGRLIDDTVLRVRLGRAGRQRVIQDFTWQRAAEIVWAAHENVARKDRW